MTVLTDFKENVFNVLEGYMSLEEFETWLYRNETLSNMMDNDAVLLAYEFNYRKPAARFEFRAVFLGFFQDEFLLWKVKSNLLELMAGTSRVESIVSDFYKLGNQGYSWAYTIGYYEYLLDNSLYDYGDSDEIINNLKTESAQLLSLIRDQEQETTNFRLSDFRFPIRERLVVKPKFDANFWE